MQATTTITGLDFILLPTQDVKRAEKFYTEVLGMEVEAHWRDVGVEFKLGHDQTLALVDPAIMGDEFSAATTGIVALRVADVDAAVAALKAKGIEFQGELIDSGVCKMMNFCDPDGNRLMLHNRYAE